MFSGCNCNNFENFLCILWPLTFFKVWILPESIESFLNFKLEFLKFSHSFALTKGKKTQFPTSFGCIEIEHFFLEFEVVPSRSTLWTHFLSQSSMFRQRLFLSVCILCSVKTALVSTVVKQNCFSPASPGIWSSAASYELLRTHFFAAGFYLLILNAVFSFQSFSSTVLSTISRQTCYFFYCCYFYCCNLLNIRACRVGALRISKVS